jgi:hypothetical protein
MENIAKFFELASRNKYRFTELGGNLTSEDVWDLQLKDARINLNLLAKALNKQIKEFGEEDFVEESKVDLELQAKFEIVKYIISVKKAEIQASKQSLDDKANDEVILAALATKQLQEINGKTTEELKAMLSKNKVSAEA